MGDLVDRHDGNINESLERFDLVSTVVCMGGAPVESVDHLISECTLYEDLRYLNVLIVIANDAGEVGLSRSLICCNTFG